MKKIIFIIFIFFVVIFIYKTINNNNEYISVIGDNYYENSLKENNCVKYLNSGDYRIIDLKNDINNNVDIKVNDKILKIQNILVKSKKLIISIGANELNYFNNYVNTNKYKYLDGLINDYEDLFNLILLFDKEMVYFIDNSSIIKDENYKKYYKDKLYILLEVYKIQPIKFTN